MYLSPTFLPKSIFKIYAGFFALTFLDASKIVPKTRFNLEKSLIEISSLFDKSIDLFFT